MAPISQIATAVRGSGILRPRSLFCACITSPTPFHLKFHATLAFFRFSQFFISPLFSASSTEREVLAVDSENTNNLQNDAWRMIQLERTLSNEQHAYHKFGTGNKVTLLEEPTQRGQDVRKELLAFHERYYRWDDLACLVFVLVTWDGGRHLS